MISEAAIFYMKIATANMAMVLITHIIGITFTVTGWNLPRLRIVIPCAGLIWASLIAVFIWT